MKERSRLQLNKIFDELWKHRGVIGLTVFLICIIGALQVYHEKQIEEVKAAALIVCDTSNKLREQLNTRGRVQKRFFQTAADARSASADLAKEAGNTKQEKIDRKAAKEYNASVKAFIKVPIIDCKATYKARRTIYVR